MVASGGVGDRPAFGRTQLKQRGMRPKPPRSSAWSVCGAATCARS